jgi:hypothetical protein
MRVAALAGMVLDIESEALVATHDGGKTAEVDGHAALRAVERDGADWHCDGGIGCFS